MIPPSKEEHSCIPFLPSSSSFPPDLIIQIHKSSGGGEKEMIKRFVAEKGEICKRRKKKIRHGRKTEGRGKKQELM